MNGQFRPTQNDINYSRNRRPLLVSFALQKVILEKSTLNIAVISNVDTAPTLRKKALDDTPFCCPCSTYVYSECKQIRKISIKIGLLDCENLARIRVGANVAPTVRPTLETGTPSGPVIQIENVADPIDDKVLRVSS